MPCAIINCTVSDDKHVWYCSCSCGKKFHAACVGAQRNHEKSILTYMLPLCYECQKRFVLEVNFDKLYSQQQESIKLNKLVLESNHKLATKFNNLNIGDGFESMEMLLSELKTAVCDNNNAIKQNDLNSGAKNDEVAIKNHLTSLFDISMQATKNNIMQYVEALTIDLTRELQNICSEFEKVSGLIIDMANHCSEHNSSQTNLTATADIVDELKTLSSAVNSLGNKTAASQKVQSPPSLEVELSTQTTNSGWRKLGNRNVWKADWSEYDARELRRLHQQKAADKAKLRKKRRKQQYVESNNSRAYPNRNQTHKRSNDKRNTNALPLDKELLAAAKERFSGPPPAPYRPTIRFQRGEVLNPYPADERNPYLSDGQTSSNGTNSMTQRNSPKTSYRNAACPSSWQDTFHKIKNKDH